VKMTESDGDYLRFELKNSRPVDLLDLTGALSAFGDAYKDYVISAGLEHVPDNVRLFVREVRSGDGASQLNITVADDMHMHYGFNYESQQANAIQNNSRRLLGPPLPTSQIYHDQILSLYQVRGDPSAKVGAKGIIEEISPLPAKIVFSSEEVKKQIIEQPENPFKKFFLVDVQAKAAEGKVRLYQIFAVKDVLDKD
jgi:hypothetical protein